MNFYPGLVMGFFGESSGRIYCSQGASTKTESRF